MATTGQRDTLFDFSAHPLPRVEPYALSFLGSVLVAFVLAYMFQSPKFPGLYFVNPKKPLEFTDLHRKQEFMKSVAGVVSRGQERAPGKSFRAITEFGDTIILPAKYAHQIRNEPNLSFSRLIEEEFHANLRGFEGMKEFDRESSLVQNVMRKQLTQSVSRTTGPLSEEAALSLQEVLADSTEWHDVVMKETALQLIARMTSRAFLGPELCRDPKWLRIATQYTLSTFHAGHQLRPWPYHLRKIVQWFLPECRTAREMVAEGHKLIGPLIQQRRAAKAAAQAEGKPIPVYNDAIEWCEQEAKGQFYDPVNIQLLLSVNSISTTSDTLNQIVLDLAQHPEFFEPLRKEVADALNEGGWQKTTLYKMKLLDSFIKESQRLKPINSVSMRRVATGKVKLPDGLEIPPGTRLVVTNDLMRSASVWEDPDRFDPHRFMRMRENPREEHLAHLVTTSPNHMGFGHGNHACPGRFFAANELKVVLSHLLLKYDWKLAPGVQPRPITMGFATPSDPHAKVSFRRRQEQQEIQI